MLRIIFVFMFLFKFCWRGGKLTQIGDHPLAVGIDPLVINVDVTVPQYVSNSQVKGKVANIPQTPSGDQQISGRLKREIAEGVRSKKEYVNHESIYQFLYDPAQQDQKLWVYLPRRQRISHLVFAYKVPKIRAKETSAVQLFRFGHLPKLARNPLLWIMAVNTTCILDCRKSLGCRPTLLILTAPGSEVPMNPPMG
jgi:hypothetical protein